MLITKLLAITDLGAEWVLWLLIFLSVISVGIMIDRAIFFFLRSISYPDELAKRLADGDFEAAQAMLAGKKGMEADVARIAMASAPKGPEAVSKMVEAQVLRSRLDYEARLSFLGTLGNNAPFLGLFGTVLGIIHAFSELGAHPGAGGVSNVMTGISEALIATAFGLFVALPAVVLFNTFQRWLRRVTQRANVLGRSVEANLLGQQHQARVP